ncbi:MAG: FtsW/RodA/SpoVE family cell cycle protein [Muribaculaceae bacterium]|nr:FtsW/RodA/SpoVE family cell cycle protein [Muribaculaceae bacterium]
MYRHETINSTADSASTIPSAGPRSEAKPVITPINPPDTHIWGVYCCIVVLSIIELYSASSFEIAKQGLYSPLFRHIGFLLIGFLIMLGISNIHYRYFAAATRPLTWISIISMVYVFFFGQVINGAKRAINLHFMSLQPAEFIKLSAVLILALILGSTQLKKDETIRNNGLKWATFYVILLSGLLFTQGLTNTLILMAICISMMTLGSLEWRKFGIIMCIFMVGAGAGAAIKMMMSKNAADQPHEVPVLVDSRGNVYSIPEAAGGTGGGSRMQDATWHNRLAQFFNSTPKYEQGINADNLQEMRSYMAQANGGLFGVFPGNSRETSRLPLAFSDYIYAIIIEDLGFAIGGVGVMLLYLWLLARAYMIARRCNQMYPAFLVTGCAVLITVQALFHMAIVTGAFPVSGQPLPLFSKGGTSIIVTSIAFGVMLSVSRFSVRNKDASSNLLKAEAEALPEHLRGENPTQF